MKKKELELALEDYIFKACRLDTENKKMKRAIIEFIDRCEAGEIRSVRTYNKFKDIIEFIDGE